MVRRQARPSWNLSNSWTNNWALARYTSPASPDKCASDGQLNPSKESGGRPVECFADLNGRAFLPRVDSRGTECKAVDARLWRFEDDLVCIGSEQLLGKPLRQPQREFNRALCGLAVGHLQQHCLHDGPHEP